MPRVAAWLVHAYTASGAIFALLILDAMVAKNFRGAFLWMLAATVVDATDGFLARAARVKERLPHFRGDRLDDIVDYLTYVFLPAWLIWRAELLPIGWVMPVLGLVCVASAFGFSFERAKTSEGFFTGFPSYWNIVAFYLFVGGLPPATNAWILVALAVLVFVPIRYVYPSRTVVLRRLTLVLTTGWGVVTLWLIVDLPNAHPAVVLASLAYPLYYAALSLALMVGYGDAR